MIFKVLMIFNKKRWCDIFIKAWLIQQFGRKVMSIGMLLPRHIYSVIRILSFQFKLV